MMIISVIMLLIPDGIFYSYWDSFGTTFLGAIGLGGIVFGSPWGVAGALIGRNWKNNLSSTWIAAIVATIIGLGSFLLILNFAEYSDYFLYPLPGVPFGIIGARIGKGWKQSSLAMWIGGILGAIVGILLFGWLYWWASVGFAVA
jgi:hypothetical protein